MSGVLFVSAFAHIKFEKKNMHSFKATSLEVLTQSNILNCYTFKVMIYNV